MYDDYLTFRSVTTALRGSRVLERAGIKTKLTRTPKSLQQQGCGYCLSMNGGVLQRAKGILSREDIPYQKIYHKGISGQWQEVAR